MATSQLTTCKTCSKEVAKQASICPYCGAKLRKSVWGKVLILLGVFLVMSVIYLFLALPIDIKSTISNGSSSTTTESIIGIKLPSYSLIVVIALALALFGLSIYFYKHNRE
ncbi:hypothetical protein Desaci_1994 [Desulfosporosinus acidiphilus SJ4]|uniref:Zinc-ribbon domain-containing protein n=1 Tax=Desulfosporosinus acidiphilus (strain DSM 22704 / JCM 16185 / SJ4) TaxID=646529 RepID=I4D595_DESAJ|nr:zinc ribbon domain-containing protein [Desulfosporosinus acidiphilus]AFM40969.1 hypothetical protein Desaci_1994 [Desulfosporosinus acidiphilus SJ4]